MENILDRDSIFSEGLEVAMQSLSHLEIQCLAELSEEEEEELKKADIEMEK